ncbi:MAG: translation elongation factor Ts [Candidatus Rokuibacteriota bacterium]|nr:MAG: translation elongation factor Ts [Candidatus Rokubacteria bacterium]
MSEIPASLVKQLRELTGAGFMDCKRALEQTGGDLEAAQQLLREQGVAQAGKRAGRGTKEGIVLSTVSGHTGAMVAVGCETEPVARNEEFLGFAEQALEAVEESGPGVVDSLEERRVEVVAKLGENVAIRGAARLTAEDGELLGEYVHPPANKIGVLLRTGGDNPAAARRLAMHISFAAPAYLRREDVPQDEIASERAIYEKQPEVEGKPDDVKAKIVEGMLAKRFFSEIVLSDQPWIHEPTKTVAEALREDGLEPVEFHRFALAE